MASPSQALSDIREEMKCSICMELLNEPKVLKCLHTYCKSCLQSTIQQGAITCPFCRETTAISETGVKALPSNFLYSRLLEIVKVQNTKSTKENALNCENCDNKVPSKFFCFDCQLFMCDDCKVMHDKIKAIRESHRVHPVKSLKQSDLKELLDRSGFCLQHGREELKFFCETCDASICRDCAIWEHRSHQYVHLKEAALKEVEKIRELLERAEGKAFLLHSEREHFESKVSRITRDMDKAADKIKSSYELVRRSINQHEAVMIEKLAEKKSMFAKFVELEISIFDEKSNNQAKCFQSSRDILETDCWGKVMKQKNNLKEELIRTAELEANKIASQLPFSSIQYVTNNEVFNLLGDVGGIFVSSTDPKECNVEGNGLITGNVGDQASFTVTTRNSAGQLSYSSIDRVDVEIRSSVMELETVEPTIQDFKDGTYTVSYVPQFAGGYNIQVSVAGEELETSPFHAQVEFKPLFTFGGPLGANQRFRKPSGVSVNKEGQTATSDSEKNCVQIFDQEGNFLKEITQYFRGGKGAKLEGPVGVAFNSAGNLVVVEQAKDRILVLNLQDWNLVRRFGKTGTEVGQFNNPSGVSVDGDDRIIVSDTNNDRIQVFSSDGKFLFKFGDEGDEILDSPYYAVYNKDRFLVSDTDNHCIKAYDSGGVFLYKFGLEGSELGAFNHPSGLAIYKHDMILVCDYHNDRMQLFKMDGTFVTSFGRMGNGLGQLSWPEDVTVLHDGTVIVCECENRRLQVFR